MTKIFCDIADINLIKKFKSKKIVKGFTTNPSLIRKAGGKDYKTYCKKILKITKKPISFEVFADDNEKITLHVSEDSESVNFLVKDRGPGIPENLIKFLKI